MTHLGREVGLLGSVDWLSGFVTASDRAVDMWIADMFVDTDQQVLNRLIQNQEFGLFSAGGSLDLEGTYVSQIGLGGWLMTVFPTLVGARGWFGEFLIYSQIAVLNAWIFTIVVDRIKLAFGTVASVVFVIMLLQPMSLAISGSPRFMIGMRVLPAVLLSLQLMKSETVPAKTVAAIFATSLIGYASGYDYVSITPATVAGVLVASAVIYRWRLKSFLKRAVLPVGATIFALAAAIGIHIVQLSLRFGGVGEALSVINYRLAKRSGLVGDSVSDLLLIESLGASPLRVLDWYLSFPILFGPAKVPILHLLSVGVLITAVVLLAFTFVQPNLDDKESRLKLGLAAGWLISLLGPLGWYLLARPSAYIHTHTDGVAWFFPTIPIGAVLVFLAVSRSLNSQNRSLRAFLLVLCVTCVVVASLIWVSQMQVRSL